MLGWVGGLAEPACVVVMGGSMGGGWVLVSSEAWHPSAWPLPEATRGACHHPDGFETIRVPPGRAVVDLRLGLALGLALFRPESYIWLFLPIRLGQLVAVHACPSARTARRMAQR